MSRLHHIRMELARDAGAPDGDPGVGYDLVLPLDDNRRLAGAEAFANQPQAGRVRRFRYGVARHYRFSMDKPWRDLPETAKAVILYGSGAEKITFTYDDNARKYEVSKAFEGVVPNLERRWRETDSAWVREEMARYQSETPCEACGGKRLKPEALAVKVGGEDIADISGLSISKAFLWFSTLSGSLTDKQMEIARRILKEITDRLRFLNNVGLDYLNLSRNSGTLSILGRAPHGRALCPSAACR